MESMANNLTYWNARLEAALEIIRAAAERSRAVAEACDIIEEALYYIREIRDDGGNVPLRNVAPTSFGGPGRGEGIGVGDPDRRAAGEFVPVILDEGADALIATDGPFGLRLLGEFLCDFCANFRFDPEGFLAERLHGLGGRVRRDLAPGAGTGVVFPGRHETVMEASSTQGYGHCEPPL